MTEQGAGGGREPRGNGRYKNTNYRTCENKTRARKRESERRGRERGGGGGKHEEGKMKESVGRARVEREGQEQSEGGCVEAHDQKEQKKKLNATPHDKEKTAIATHGQVEIACAHDVHWHA